MTTATRPASARKPADRKPKAVDGFTFEAEGATFVIPAPSEVLATIPGRAFRDALMNGDEGQMKFSFVCLEKVVTDNAVLDALYAKPVPETLEIVAAWFKSADRSGATLPQS